MRWFRCLLRDYVVGFYAGICEVRLIAGLVVIPLTDALRRLLTANASVDSLC